MMHKAGVMAGKEAPFFSDPKFPPVRTSAGILPPRLAGGEGALLCCMQPWLCGGAGGDCRFLLSLV